MAAENAEKQYAEQLCSFCSLMLNLSGEREELTRLLIGSVMHMATHMMRALAVDQEGFQLVAGVLTFPVSLFAKEFSKLPDLLGSSVYIFNSFFWGSFAVLLVLLAYYSFVVILKNTRSEK